MQQHAQPARRVGPGTSPRRPATPARILIVDDDRDACEALRQVLKSEGHDATSERSPRRALQRISTIEYDLVVTDVAMDEMNGLEMCRQVLQRRPGMPVIMVTGRGSLNTVVEALRIGARDFLVKPVDPNSLIAAVAKALGHQADEHAPTRPARQTEPSAASPLLAVLGHSAAIQRVNDLVSNLSSTLVSVLLEGETGTGKEVIARTIHANSQLRGGPFVALNCAAIPLGLLESELFGHARGAFTDARTARVGLLVQANGGTLLLDEIGELPLAVQPKLLRAVQERKVRPLGQRDEVSFDCRIIAATNRNLEIEVVEKRFREDLYYRLNVMHIQVPPLRERGEDILELAQHFLDRFTERSFPRVKLSATVAQTLLAYAWPGNVRELQNCIEGAVALSSGGELTDAELPDRVRYSGTLNSSLPEASVGMVSLAEVERLHILRAVELLGDERLAAQRLGIDRRTLNRRLESYKPFGPT